MRNGLRDGATSVVNLIRERRGRSELYGKAHYWDSRAKERSGLSRSLWPSNAYNLLWDERQRRVLERTLGEVSGLRILDVGCGTGRMTRHLAREGASVIGVDFSSETVTLAAEETRQAGLSDRTRFETGDVLQGFENLGHFDRILVVGCLSVACRSEADLRQALQNLRGSLVPGGQLILLEPIHRSALLRRVLALDVNAWIAHAEAVGLRLVHRDAMGFVPLRLVASVREAPVPWLRAPFEAFENLLDTTPLFHLFADYKLLVLQAP